ARALYCPLHVSDACCRVVVGAAETDLARYDRDSAPGMPKGVVIDPAFTWGDDRLPLTPWSETVIYEVHAKGFTAQHPDVPPGLRGTFAGLCRGPVIDYLRSLGVTAVELMPVHQSVSAKHLVDRGLVNSWGSNSIRVFAPAARS